MKHGVLIVGMLFCGQVAHGQKLEKELEAVEAVGNNQETKNENATLQIISSKDIKEWQPEDVGQIMQKFTGVSLKNYGGLGGLKTFSFRGIGSEHTSVIIDGFLQSNAQVGQVNLGQVQTNNVKSIRFSNGSEGELTQVFALTTASLLSINTIESEAAEKKFGLHLQSKVGSFGQMDQYLSTQIHFKKVGFSAYGKYRQATGNYPFRLNFGNFAYKDIRKNNQLQEGFAGGFLFFQTKSGKPIRLGYKHSTIDQGLPGAVVLYNNLNKQFLYTQQNQVTIDWQFSRKSWTFRPYALISNQFLAYEDSSYLNAQNYLRSEYLQYGGFAGTSAQYDLNEKAQFYGGVEAKTSLLDFLSTEKARVSRTQIISALGYRLQTKRLMLNVRSTLQQVIENGINNKDRPPFYVPSFLLHIQRKESGILKHVFGFLSSYSVRLPSFNELYFGQIGNKELNAEKVGQIQFSHHAEWTKGKFKVENTAQIYYNHVRDKILAIPTKNLFVWSIRNIGIVNIIGLDLNQDLSYRINEKWSVSGRVNYSLQQALDYSDTASPTYRNQLAYIPLHSGNLDVAIYRKSSGLRLSCFASSYRYSLNENIAKNEVPGFAIFDASIFHRVKLKDKHMIQFQFNVRNVTNSPYVFVRSYPMPGINYLFSISYDF